MKKQNLVKGLALSLAMATTATSVAGIGAITEPVLADSGDTNINNNGVVSLGKGNASIKIQGNEGQSLVGKRFELFQLFNAENAVGGESINYTFNDKYKLPLQTVVARCLNQRDNTSLSHGDVTEYMVVDYIQSLNTNVVEGAYTDQTLEGRYSDFRYFVEDLRTEIKNQGITGDIFYVNQTDAGNGVTIAGLPYGYYVIDEISTHDENDEDYFASSLCMVDTANPTASINIKSDYPSIIKKIQEDDNKDAIGNDGWNDIADYEIGQTVPYKYESTISDMNGYDTYYYAFHDSMDEALTLHDDKDEIEIVINKGKKSYKLKDSEYNLVTKKSTDADKLDEEDTFLIEIEDIKKIIDKQFNNIDQLGHNDYSDMTVTLTYNATLNDKAAKDTGRPGFENDVRLEFSNDSDSNGSGKTGYTPWDTVVCFTYKLNGLKTNNHDKVLQGAKFRLYSDKDCKNEVYVKSVSDVEAISDGVETTGLQTPTEEEVGGNAYIVINRDSVNGTDHTGGDVPAEAVEMVSDADGNFTIYGLDGGTYYLKEVEAPAGYRQLLDPITITVKPTFTTDRNDYVAGQGATDKILKTLTATAHIKEFYSGKYTEEDAVLNTSIEDGSADIKIVNEVGSKLPVTGSSAMLVMLGVGVVLMGGALIVSKKGKKEN